MNFTAPAALLWALLAIPIVIFYILKVRLRRVPVSTVMFWEQVIEQQQARSIWQKLRHMFSLLMQLALLALLVLALSDPYFTWEERQQRRVVLIVDNSASMQATDVAPTRFEQARKLAHDVIDRLRPRDEMAIVAAGTQPRVVCGLTGHHRTLQSALNGVNVLDGPTRVAEALDLGRRLIGEHANGQLVVISDGGFPGAAELATDDDASTIWLPVGRKSSNLAITRFQVRRSLADPLGYYILIEARNNSTEPVEGRLELDLDESLIDVWPLKLAPGETWTKHIEQTSADGGVLTAQINHEDALALDNVARAILPVRKRQPVILVTSGNRFLQGVFTANPLVDLNMTPTVPSAVPAGSVLVLHKIVPDQLPAGDVVVLQPQTGSSLWDVAGALENPLVAKQDRDSPLMANVRLDNVLLPEAMKLTAKAPATLLAETENGDPLYFAVTHPHGRVLVLSVNLDRGDLPLRTAFPIIFSNALTWFEGSGGELREAITAGTLAQITLPRELQRTADGTPATTLQFKSPAGTVSQVPVTGETATVGPLTECGIWELTRELDQETPGTPYPSAASEPAPSLQLACNLTDPEESNLQSHPEPPKSQAIVTAGLAHPLWFYLVAGAWGLMGMEWWMYQRRKIA